MKYNTAFKRTLFGDIGHIHIRLSLICNLLVIFTTFFLVASQLALLFNCDLTFASCAGCLDLFGTCSSEDNASTVLFFKNCSCWLVAWMVFSMCFPARKIYSLSAKPATLLLPSWLHSFGQRVEKRSSLCSYSLWCCYLFRGSVALIENKLLLFRGSSCQYLSEVLVKPLKHNFADSHNCFYVHLQTAQRKASLLLVDRTLDIASVIGHFHETLLDKMTSVLARLPGHNTDIAVDMSSLCSANRYGGV